MTRVYMNVKDEAAAQRIAAEREKSHRNPSVEKVSDGYVVSWDARAPKRTSKHAK